MREALMKKNVKWPARSKEEWEAIFKAQDESPLSVKGFCREQGIDYKQFLYYRSNIRTRAMKALAVSKPTGIMPTTRERSFIPVRVDGNRGVRLRFSHGMVLESDSLPPPAWIAEVALRWAGVGPC
jgi:hypothetical protein